MRRSHSQIAHGRHMVNTNVDKWNVAEQESRKHSLCRDGYNSLCLETGHIHVYLQKRDSRNSLSNNSGEQTDITSVGSNEQVSVPIKTTLWDTKNKQGKKNNEKEENMVDIKDSLHNAIVSNSAVSLRLSENEDDQGTDDTIPLIGNPSPTSSKKSLLPPKNKTITENLKIPPITAPTITTNTTSLGTSSLSKEREAPNVVPKPRSRYLGEVVWQVDDTVYCGGIEAVSNLNLLCRLNIEYIVDLSGLDEEVASRRNECPCLCSRKTPHSRMIMAIKLNDEDSLPKQNLIPFFEDVVKLISRAKVCKKSVLIHSIKGRNRAPAFVAAYMMHEHHITRVQAVTKISDLTSKIRPGVSISDNLQRALMKWQSVQGIRSQDIHLDAKLFTPLFAVKKTAWT
uniref:protein-tyrosine-phosphatase n=1 Tax=Parastrongyloides trichosuri TaxID=131310 RepID=A0A0N4ZCL4_PARTI